MVVVALRSAGGNGEGLGTEREGEGESKSERVILCDAVVLRS